VAPIWRGPDAGREPSISRVCQESPLSASFDLLPVAGGYSLRFTGMDVRKKDGSPHGVGILPTVPVSRTLAGVIAGRDEVLEKEIEVVSHP
jgi:hypothetical protein